MTSLTNYQKLQIEGSGMSFGTIWGNLMESAITTWFAGSIPDKNARILDFGCGEGRGLLALKNLGYRNVTGLDINPEKISMCHARGLNAVHGDIYSILDMEFDYVFTSHTLEHMESIQNTIYLLNSITKNSIFYIIPIRETMEMVQKDNPSHVSPINDPNEFIALTNGLGLKNTSAEVYRLCSELWGIIDCRYVRSPARSNCDTFIKRHSTLLRVDSHVRKTALYVGVAGDPPGGEYSPYFPYYNIQTIDIDPKWKPDILADITKSGLSDQSYDLIICSNVIEHVPNVFDIPDEFYRLLKPRGHLLVDCPWNLKYHGEEPSFGDFWRLSKDAMNLLFKKFDIIDVEQTEITSHLFAQKI